MSFDAQVEVRSFVNVVRHVNCQQERLGSVWSTSAIMADSAEWVITVTMAVYSGKSRRRRQCRSQYYLLCIVLYIVAVIMSIYICMLTAEEIMFSSVKITISCVPLIFTDYKCYLLGQCGA